MRRNRVLTDDYAYPAMHLIGQRISSFRIHNGISQKDLAKKIKMTRPGVSALERGDFLATFRILYPIAEALDINVHDLIPSLEEIKSWKPEPIIRKKLAKRKKDQLLK